MCPVDDTFVVWSHTCLFWRLMGEVLGGFQRGTGGRKNMVYSLSSTLGVKKNHRWMRQRIRRRLDYEADTREDYRMRGLLFVCCERSASGHTARNTQQQQVGRQKRRRDHNNFAGQKNKLVVRQYSLQGLFTYLASSPARMLNANVNSSERRAFR